jgi:transposase InsO family protein
MEITSTAKIPFEKCALDIVGPTTVTTKGNRYILTFQDELIKFIAAIPIATQEAETVAREFVLDIGLKFAMPNVILTDQGSNFVSELFKRTCKLLRIKTIQTTAYHQEWNEGLERGQRVLVEYLRHYINEDQKDWDDWVPHATCVYNVTITQPPVTHHLSCSLDTNREFLPPLQEKPTPRCNYDDYVNELKDVCSRPMR